MRILHIADSFAPRIGGIERQVESLAHHQRADGHEVSVVTSVAGPADVDFPVYRPGSPRWVMFGSPPHQYRLVRRAIEAARPDIVHTHFSLASPLAVRAARLANRRAIPTAITVHSLWPSIGIVRGANQPFGLGPVRGGWSAVSAIAADDVRRILPRVGEVAVVPNIVDTQWWRPVRSARATDELAVRLIVVGRLARLKRVGPLLDVLAAVRRELDPAVAIRLNVVGEGNRRPELEKQIRRLGMGGWVHLLGQAAPEQIRELLYESDLFVAPAEVESFGIAALEARSAGLPVIGHRGTGLADFIVDGKEGLLVDGDADMVRVLLDLLRNPAHLRQLRDTTSTTSPSIEADDAVRAVERLYSQILPTAVTAAVLPPR